MTQRQRYARPYSVTINCDPVTWDRLTALATGTKDSREKIVYLATLAALDAAEKSPEASPEPLYDWSKVTAFPPLR